MPGSVENTLHLRCDDVESYQWGRMARANGKRGVTGINHALT
jgi:hypothetical protein